jgi:hypothetical protein
MRGGWSSSHGHAGAAFADRVAFSVGDDQQRLIERIGDRRSDRSDASLAEASAILQHVTADQLESVLVIALGLHPAW